MISRFFCNYYCLCSSSFIIDFVSLFSTFSTAGATCPFKGGNIDFSANLLRDNDLYKLVGFTDTVEIVSLDFTYCKPFLGSGERSVTILRGGRLNYFG